MAKFKPDWNGAMCRYHFWQWNGPLHEDPSKRTPLQDVRANLKKLKQEDTRYKLEKLDEYNKVVLAKTVLSTTTMFWAAKEAFLVEDFPNGRFRVSWSTPDREYMKRLFKAGQVRWQTEG